MDVDEMPVERAALSCWVLNVVEAALMQTNGEYSITLLTSLVDGGQALGS